MLYSCDAATPLSLDPASAAAAAAFQSRMAACNGAAAAPYRSPTAADYWATTGAYAAAYSPVFDPLSAAAATGSYCARAAAGASSMSSCAVNGSGSGHAGPPSRAAYSHEQNAAATAAALTRIYHNDSSW